MSALAQERQGRVLTLRLARPERGNALTDPAVLEPLSAAIRAAGQDEAVSVLVLTGSGEFFSAGGDIDDIAHRRGMFAGDPARLRAGYRHGIHRLLTELHETELPTVAAVNGAAVGAGFDLPFACDIRLMGRSAWLRPGFAGLGLVPGDGGAWLLRAAIGPAQAAEILLANRRIAADEALARGMVSQVAEDADLGAAALALAQRIAEQPRPALTLTKRLLQRAAHQPFRDALEDAAALQALCHHTPEHAEILHELRERRDREGRAIP